MGKPQLGVVLPYLNTSELNIVQTPDGQYQVDETNSDDEESGIENDITYQPTTINIEHSSDVVIGPVTQFHGPVTIVQAPNRAEIKSNDVYSQFKQSDSTEREERSGTSIKRRSILLATGIVILLAITTVIVYFVKIDNIVEIEEPIISEKLGKHKLIRRNIWGGRPPLYNRPLKHPTEYVIISHTAGNLCTSISNCSSTMQQIQSYHVSHYKSPDIGYNFLIGGDGNIYVGRGWDEINFQENDCIGICFIGNFIYDKLTQDMINATQLLLQEGVNLGKLSGNYKLVSHNQTYATESPGQNVYKEIKTWDHFLPGNNISWSV